MSLPIPNIIREDLSLSFTLKLLSTKRDNDSIMVVVDRFSKMPHFIACKKFFDAQNVALLFFKEIINLHGLPRNLTSDRDIKSMSHFRQDLWQRLQTDLRMSSTYHSQTDRQTEIVNHTLNSMIHCLACDHLGKWDEVLNRAEFSYNSMINRSTDQASFSIVYTKPPNHTVDLSVLLKTHNKPVEQVIYNFTSVINTMKKRLEESSLCYKQAVDKSQRFKDFKVGDLVMVHLHKERFSVGTYSKAQAA